MGTISKNFSYKEFEASDVAKRFHIVNVINTAEVRDAILDLVLDVLQPLRTAWGKPLNINSGYRSPELNAHPLIKGSPTSQHVKGEAADIAADNPYALAKLALDMRLPFDQMILYPTFVHFSHRHNGPQRGQILYNYRYTGKHLG